MPVRIDTTATTVLGGLSLAVLLAGCTTSTAVDTPVQTDSGSDSSSSDSSSGSYTDGDYSANGKYQSPGGTESIEVELTLADGVVDGVTVTGEASGGNAERYQSQFADGIAAEVVGKDIDDLAVDKVAGSSLTSDGFNAAVEQIKADAGA